MVRTLHLGTAPTVGLNLIKVIGGCKKSIQTQLLLRLHRNNREEQGNLPLHQFGINSAEGNPVLKVITPRYSTEITLIS